MNIDKEINKIWSYYDNFNYQEALNICDKILNRYPYFEEILEVKAYIFYINGYLEESIVCWESNFSENNNTSAKFCLDNLKNYKELKNLYNDALIDIENKKLNNALDKLITCSHSDFNKIPVGNAIEKCNLLKLGVLSKDIDIEEKLIFKKTNSIFKFNLIQNIIFILKYIKNSLKRKLSLN